MSPPPRKLPSIERTGDQPTNTDGSTAHDTLIPLDRVSGEEVVREIGMGNGI